MVENALKYLEIKKNNHLLGYYEWQYFYSSYQVLCIAAYIGWCSGSRFSLTLL